MLYTHKVGVICLAYLPTSMISISQHSENTVCDLSNLSLNHVCAECASLQKFQHQIRYMTMYISLPSVRVDKCG